MTGTPTSDPEGSVVVGTVDRNHLLLVGAEAEFRFTGE